MDDTSAQTHRQASGPVGHRAIERKILRFGAVAGLAILMFTLGGVMEGRSSSDAAARAMLPAHPVEHNADSSTITTALLVLPK